MINAGFGCPNQDQNADKKNNRIFFGFEYCCCRGSELESGFLFGESHSKSSLNSVL